MHANLRPILAEDPQLPLPLIVYDHAFIEPPPSHGSKRSPRAFFDPLSWSIAGLWPERRHNVDLRRGRRGAAPSAAVLVL